MTSIFSGQLYRNFVTDQNTLRLANYDVNRFQKTVVQQTAQSQREKSLREGLEFHQAKMADLQTKMNELTEKLNNLYRRYIETNASFNKVKAEPRYTGTSEALDLLPDVNDPSGLPNDYPTGAPNNILPFDDPGRIRNYSYNPYFGSKAIDQSDSTVNRTLWTEPKATLEKAYQENGAFWSAVSYLWGWDLDRINATYVTTTNQDDKQVNVTALQPNKQQMPPLRPGDRFPINWSTQPGNPTPSLSYPAVNLTGLRPGGVDFSHATDSLNTLASHLNVVGKNTTNWGWEFDDLPLALEVTSVSQQPDGNTVPNGFKVVYDIPPTHPFYEELKVLNGTEPKIIDAPKELRKERLNNEGFRYTGTAYFPGSNVVGFQVGPLFRTSRGSWVIAQPGENEYSAPGNYSATGSPIAAFELQTCLPGLTIDANTKFSFKYRYRVHQNSAQFGSTWDDSGPGVPSRFGFSRHDWNSAGNQAYGGGNTFGVPMPATFDVITNQPAMTLHSLGTAPSANTFGTDYLKTSGFEELFAKVVPVPGNTSAVRVEFYFEGDINNLEIEVEDFQIVDYTGDMNSWTQGKYNQGNLDPILREGDPLFTTANAPGNAPHEVVSKYYPNVYQFTQFNDQYNNSFNSVDRNDIVRSPWEFALLNIGQDSGLSGEMWLDLNGRRLNLDHDLLDTQMYDWERNIVAPSGMNFDLLADGVTKAYEFIPVIHPTDDCGPNPTMNILPGGGTGSPYDPSGPTGGILVDSTVGFSAGMQVLVNGQLRTIVAILDDAGSPGGTTTDPVFDDPAIPTYEYREPFASLPAAARNGIADPRSFAIPAGSPLFGSDGDGDGTPNEPADWPSLATLAALYPPPAWHPHAGNPSNPLFWAQYTQSTSPTVPARREIYLDSPVSPAPTSGTIVRNLVVPETPREDQFMDSDPLTDFAHREIKLHDEIILGETPLDPSVILPTSETPLDPGRTANPTWANPDFYNTFGNGYVNPATTSGNGTSFITGISNDTTNTVDRVMGSDLSIAYRVSIPTNDVNVLRKENNLLFNFGSIDERDWGIEIRNPYMEFRTVPEYLTVPRYRVDAGGNVYDAFGKGYYDLRDLNGDGTVDNQKDLQSVDRVYTTSGGATLNGQVSNFDLAYDMSNYETYNMSAADFETFITEKNRLSLNGDDYNLFDYVPDLNEVDGNVEGARYGESYIGSLPTNFYYYREPLDQSLSGSGTPLTAGVLNGDQKAALNFNANGSNRAGIYNDPDTTIVHNTMIPAWANVKMGVAQQDARITNTQSMNSFAVWQGFPGLGGEPHSAIAVSPNSSGVTNAFSALGEPNNNPASMADGSTLILDMGRPVNTGGHLILHEVVSGQSSPHVIPLPLQDISVWPAAPATSYRVGAYGPETVTRTGSRYISNFGQQIFDGLDGNFDNTWTSADATLLLQQAQATVSTTHPPSTWTQGLILHVDNAAAFDVEGPGNEVYLGTDTSTRYRVVAKNTETSPQTLYLIPSSGSIPAQYQNDVHTDLQIRQLVGEYTVSVTDASGSLSANGNYLRIQYEDNNSNRPGLIDAVQISSEMDRVGRLAGDDVRTPGVETNRIGPEVFTSPRGYIQSDAQLDLNLVSQDTDGNPVVRKLKRIDVSIDSGEQLIPNRIVQSYSTDGTFDINGTWPIAIYERDRQLNPEVVSDLNILVGHSQGIINGSQATNSVNPRVTVTSTDGFAIGEEVTINGVKRFISNIVGNDLLLSSPLSYPPKLGDTVSLGDANGTRELALFLNKSYAMSAGAPVKVELVYDEYEPTGYPPQVDLTTPVRTNVSETIGFSDANPSAGMMINQNNTGTGTLANPIQVNSTAGFTAGEQINIHGQTYTIASLAGGIVTDRPIVPPPQGGEITRTNYQNFLVVGKGKSGGSYNNEFTNELKRIIDNPEYKEVFRMNLYRNVFITASVSTPFNDLLSSKFMLTWDRRQREMELLQTSFSAYYKSI